MGDKIDKADADAITEKVAEVRKAIADNNQDEIKTRREALEQKIYEVSSKLYQQAAPEAGAPQQGGEAPKQEGGDGVVDADYTEVE